MNIKNLTGNRRIRDIVIFIFLLAMSLFIILRTNVVFSQDKIKIIPSKTTNIELPISWPDKRILDTMEKIKERLGGNFFPSPKNDRTFWLSVSQGQYDKQFYSRDTFVTARGGIYMGDPYLEYFKQAVRWFSKNMEGTGYIPLWFRQTSDLNTYYFSPYSLSIDSGGVRQADHILEYIDTMWLVYSWTGDEVFLAEQLPYARSAWNYLESNTSNYLINMPVTKYSGLDWADKVLRGSIGSFVQAYWYRATISLAYMEEAMGNIDKSRKLLRYSDSVKSSINRNLKTYSQPKGSGDTFGHYLAWKKGDDIRDYFEVDSNLFMVAEKIPNYLMSKQITQHFVDNQNIFFNGTGATKVLEGAYDNDDVFDNLKVGEYQNGGYWYIVSYPVCKALAVQNYPEILINNLNNTLDTFNSSDSGLSEWYYENKKTGGAPNYSWSLAYPFYLVYNCVLGIETNPDGMVIHPTLPKNIKNISLLLKYRGKDLRIILDVGKQLDVFISNKELAEIEENVVTITNR